LACWGTAALSAQGDLCAPSAEIVRELEQASSGAPEQGPAEQLIVSLRNLRARFPENLFVHLAYQDAVKQRGVEGHLKEVFEDYLILRTQHPDDPFHLYLFGRALEGRTTPEAISLLEGVLKLDPAFAPAHRSLAEIYGSVRFRDRAKEKSERAQFQQACPASAIASQPPPLPPPGDFSAAERLLGKSEAKDRVVELVFQAFEQNEWRQQQIRPFDWYTEDEKKQAALNAMVAQWRGWALLVRHYRAVNLDDKAQQQLSEMQERFERIRGNRYPELYWTGAITLVRLHAEDKQTDKVTEMLKQMEKFTKAKPDRKRSAELARLKSTLVTPRQPKAAKSVPSRQN
jgi:hypothetical protein